MWRSINRLPPIGSLSFISFFGREHPNDIDRIKTPLPDSPKTGFERVKKMFTKTDMDEFSIEFQNVVQSWMCGAFIGACLGGFLNSRMEYLNFIENNHATAFTTPMEARKKLQDKVTVAFGKGVVRWGWRISVFTGIFSLISTTISVYYDETTLTEYVTAGAITGAVYKANLGLRASVAGCIVGAALSSICGLLILGTLKITGVSMGDIRKSLTLIHESRVYHLNQAIEKSAEIKNDDLTRHHDAIIKTHGEQKIEDIK